MGSKGSKHHHVHVHHTVQAPDPEIERKAREAEAKAIALKAKAEAERVAREAKSMAEKLASSVSSTIERIKTMDLKSSIVKASGERHVGIIGPISSGKTTMQNIMFGLSNKVAMGHCTSECTRVYDKDGLIIWDTHGDDTSFRFFDPKELAFIKGLDLCVITFNSDIKAIANLLRVVYAANKNIIVVRTKVDECDGTSAKTVDEEKFLDGENVKEVLKLDDHFTTYCISSHNVKNGKTLFDWDKVKSLIYGK